MYRTELIKAYRSYFFFDLVLSPVSSDVLALSLFTDKLEIHMGWQSVCGN